MGETIISSVLPKTQPEHCGQTLPEHLLPADILPEPAQNSPSTRHPTTYSRQQNRFCPIRDMSEDYLSYRKIGEKRIYNFGR
jgi:hypothetical protein